jgi:hypothetical protein
MSVSGPNAAGYVKAKSRESRAAVLKTVSAIEKKGVACSWRMSKTTDAKQTKQMTQSIAASHLYPMAKIARVVEDRETKRKTVVFDVKTSHRRVGEVGHWIVIANGDGNEAAFVCAAFECDSKGVSAVVPESCTLSNGKLKNALIYFGPQNVPGELHDELIANIVKFPKTKRAVQLLPATFAHLQAQC